MFPYADAERLRWHFIPNEMFPRKGVSFRTMSPAQKEKAHALLKSGLSQKGYLTATAIIDLEDTLRAIENSPRFARSPLDYQFTRVRHARARGASGAGASRAITCRCTSPSPTAGWRPPRRPSPGRIPPTVKDGPKKGLRVLAPLEDDGRAVVEALTAESARARRVITDMAPNDIVSGNKNDIAPLTPPGIAIAQMTAAQREATDAR